MKQQVTKRKGVTTKNTKSQKKRKKISSKKQSNKKQAIFSKRTVKLMKAASNFMYYVVIVAILLFSTMFILNKDVNKSYFGYRFYNVLTNSMVPQKDSLPGGFYAGDVTIVKMMDGKDAQVDDIVTFTAGEDGQSFLTHRLREKLTELNGQEGDYIVTKGDANNTDDPPIPADRIVGKVVMVIPKVGIILEFFRNNFIVCLVFLFCVFGFFFFIRFYFNSPPKKVGSKSSNKKKRQRN